MRRPVQLGNRNATTSACVGWDDRNIENRLTVRKPAASLRKAANRRSHKFYRIINEVPTILMILIVILVVVKPFAGRE
jgi:hypothetical protein